MTVVEEIGHTRLRRLARMARALGRSAALYPMVEIAAEEGLAALGGASASVSRLEQRAGVLRTLINVGKLGPSEVRWPKNETYRLRDFSQLRGVVTELRVWTVFVGDPTADAQEVELLRSLGKGSGLGAPLVVDGGLWGEFYATRDWNDPPFTDADVAYVEVLTAILSGAVSRALHVESLERLAFLDPLTGLANRRALDQAAAEAFDAVALRAGRSTSVVAFDADGLKKVNDRDGHAAGDRLLVSLAALLAEHFSVLPGSLIARPGGDEFTVLVTGHDPAAVVTAAKGFCEAAHELPVGYGVSCGIASTSHGREQEGPGGLFRAADQALYEAKRSGGGSLVLAPFDRAAV
ncbi:MAG: hypothetical protein QOH75_494 [Actinomycetota bacterium]|jgi:diguanylate cyclase (GGDEF)-like protein|nr:hypothetical protein [Actinomycetota bacterium]